jgi:hypothetical protein
MANALKENVWVVDTDGACTISAKVRVVGVLLASDGTNTASLVLKEGGSGGTTIYQSAVLATTTIPTFHQVNFQASDLYADIGGTGAKAYIYLK